MTTKFAIIGAIIGDIWMPATECWKDVTRVFTRSKANIRRSDEAATLRDMVLAVTNSGDFQSCSLTGDSVLRVTRETWSKGRRVTRQRWWDLTLFPSIADCVAADKFVSDWA